MNNYIVTGIVLLIIGIVLLIIGIVYKGYSKDLTDGETWKRVIFWLGVVFIFFSLIIFLIGFKKSKSKSTSSEIYLLEI